MIFTLPGSTMTIHDPLGSNANTNTDRRKGAVTRSPGLQSLGLWSPYSVGRMEDMSQEMITRGKLCFRE